jgi:uncharacterized protein
MSAVREGPDRLRTGWAFPPLPDPVTQHLPWKSGAALVRQSIVLILDTDPGERVMRPDFGCGLRRFLMEPNTPSTRAAIAREVDAALRAFEDRIELQAVDVTPTDDAATVLVTIAYAHVRDRSPARLELPFRFDAPDGAP